MSIPRNYWIAGIIALAVALWMLSGVIIEGEGKPGAQEADVETGGRAFRVEVTEFPAETIQRRIIAQGQVKPERFATLQSQTEGQVEAVLVDSGQPAEEGDVLVRLAMDDREARLEEAKALLQQRRLEYEASRRLGESGLQSAVRQEEAAAALAAARAVLQRIEVDIAHTRIRAPFDGIVDEVMVEVGDFAAKQTPIASFVDNTTLIAEAYLSQRHFDSVRSGGGALVTPVSGNTRSGRIVTIAPRAEASSRTFRVEIRIPNPDGVPANTSAEIVIPTGKIAAHHLSPALLELDDSGRLGVKIASTDGRVAFLPVEIVRTDPEGVWVVGLPERARVITAGGGFVSPGQMVDVVMAGADA